MAKPTTARITTASPPTTMATSFLELFFLPLGEATAFFFFSLGLPFSVFESAFGAPSAGASALKRYLHFGHSTLVPIRLGSVMRTWFSQLGHGTLKLAMEPLRGYPPPVDVIATI